MIFNRKWFKFPGPKDLGMSDSNNAMASRMFPNEGVDEYHWEDYEDRLKELYPLKFFLVSTLPDFIRMTYLKLIGWKLRDFKWWFQSFIIRRDHMLDLRQPNYKHGYLEPDQKMLYAMFNILNEFVGENLSDVMYLPTEKEVSEDTHGMMARQRDTYFEVAAIHRWWNIDRVAEHKAYDDALRVWGIARQSKSPDAEQLFKELNAIEQANDAKLDEMIARLMKVRRHLWS